MSVSGDDAVLGSAEADVQDRHPNGHLLTVEQVEVFERSIALQVALVNGRTDPISLSCNRLWLVDDVGNSYEFSPPEQNSGLEVGPGEELSGTVVLLGVLDPDATNLTLRTDVNDPQETIDTANRQNDGGSPKLLLEGLPLPRSSPLVGGRPRWSRPSSSPAATRRRRQEDAPVPQETSTATAGGTELEITSPGVPESVLSIDPAEPGSEVSVEGSLPEAVLSDGASVGETAVEVQVAELLGGLDTRDSGVGTETVVLLPDDITFDFDEATLRPEARKSLSPLAEPVQLSEDQTVAVVGHTDSRGNPEYNLDLSQRRAQAVADVLVAEGVEQPRLQPVGRGADEPVAENENADGSDNPEGRGANRRVKVLIDDLPGQG